MVSSRWFTVAALLQASLLPVRSAGEGVLTFVGSGGCDGDDKGCQDPPVREKILQAIRVLPSGEAVNAELSVNVGDLPAWMALKGSPAAECIFVTRPNMDDILSIKVGPGGEVSVAGHTPSGGRTPIFAAVTANQQFLLVANYNGPDDTKVSNGSSVSSLRIEGDCILTLLEHKAHAGSSVIPSRQGGAHPHSFVPGRNDLAFACDLGMDTVFTYRVAADGKLTEVARVKTAPGLGPRHLVQHPASPFVYVVCEMGQVVLAYRLGSGGSLNLLQTASLLPKGVSGDGSKAAELVMTADGSALYVTNRGGQNTVTVFGVGDDGHLKQLQQVATVAYPRGMTLLGDDRQLLVAGQSKSVVVSYAVRDDHTLEEASRVTDGVPPHPAAFLPVPRLRTASTQDLYI